MVDFLYDLKDYDEYPESTADFTGIGVINILKAICNVQKTLSRLPKSIFNREDFFYGKVEHLRSPDKEE